MTPEEHLQRHLDLCREVYEQMCRDGTWPWAEDDDDADLDSQDPEDLVEYEE